MVDVTALGLGRLVLGIADSLGQHEFNQSSQSAQIVALQKQVKSLEDMILTLKKSLEDRDVVHTTSGE